MKMIIWINGAFGSGKTTAAYELHKRIKNSCVYDPENAGFFIRKNSPAEARLSQIDFQDITLWRETNYKMLKLITDNFDGIIIVPMTLVNPKYYDEIIGKLKSDGMEVRHFILYASKETILKHISKREFTSVKKLKQGRGDSFAANAIDRCIYSFDNYIKDEKIFADNKSVDDIVAEIAEKSSVELSFDKRSKLKKVFDRYFVLFKHIRK